MEYLFCFEAMPQAEKEKVGKGGANGVVEGVQEQVLEGADVQRQGQRREAGLVKDEKQEGYHVEPVKKEHGLCGNQVELGLENGQQGPGAADFDEVFGNVINIDQDAGGEIGRGEPYRAGEGVGARGAKGGGGRVLEGPQRLLGRKVFCTEERRADR